MKNTIHYLSICCLVMTLFSCKKDDEPSLNDLNKEAIQNYANIVLANYEDAYTTAITLKQKIDAFVANPTSVGFEECKTAWKAARLPYGQTEAFRFYGGPIDGDNGLEGYLNAWPLDENFIDYVEGNATAGIINNPTDYPNITKQVIFDLNESISETSIFTGYHAIEFLLWGQDFNANSAGTRPYTDYLTSGGTAQNQARRKTYLQVVTDLLVEHLAEVRDAWKVGSAYRESFVNNADTDVILGNIFTGIGELCKGELAGERMFVAVDEQDQENEHSCFSDNTINDIKMNFLGIKNVYLGTYLRTDGTTITGRSFAEIAQKINKIKADAATDALNNAEAKINLIPTPFDQAILNNSQKILDAVDALRPCSDKLVDAGTAIGAKL
jgi:putative iron-regulated protein